MLILDGNATSRGLKASRFNPATQSWSTPVTIDALGTSGASHLTADFDRNGNLVAGYRDITLTRSRYASSTNGTSWTPALSVSGVNQGVGARVRINPATSTPAMTYYDRAGNTVYYSSCSDTVTACASSGWNPTTVDSTAGVSGLAAGNEQVLMTELVFSSSGTPSVIYPRGAGSTGHLVKAEYSSGTFSVSTLLSGVNGALTGSAALNFGVAGWNVSAGTNGVGGLTAALIGPGNWLYGISCGD